jgi:hypothetical protein
VPKNLQKEGPRDHINGFSYVNLQQDRRESCVVYRFASKLYLSKVVMYSLPFDERTSVAQHQHIQDCAQAPSQALGDKLAEAVD